MPHKHGLQLSAMAAKEVIRVHECTNRPRNTSAKVFLYLAWLQRLKKAKHQTPYQGNRKEEQQDINIPANAATKLERSIPNTAPTTTT
jgi:hypothetical protein